MRPAAKMSWDHQRPPDATRMIIETGQAHHVAVSELLRGTGLSPETLEDQRTLVEAGQELAVARNLISAIGDQPGLGVEAGARYTLGNVGILGFAALSSQTLRAALRIVVRYLALGSTFVEIKMHENADEVTLEFADSQIPDDVRGFLVERDLTAIAQVATVLLGAGLAQIANRIELRVAKERAHDLTAIFGRSDIQYNAERTAVWLPAAILDQRLPQGNPQTAELCEQQCRQLLQARQHRTGTAHLVRSRLLGSPTEPPSMDAIARSLNISTRTLRRQLQVEGTTYRSLLDEVRETLALELLANTGLTVEEVASRLGYAETASFTHAFIRWRGHAPSRHRRRA